MIITVSLAVRVDLAGMVVRVDSAEMVVRAGLAEMVVKADSLGMVSPRLVARAERADMARLTIHGRDGLPPVKVRGRKAFMVVRGNRRAGQVSLKVFRKITRPSPATMRSIRRGMEHRFVASKTIHSAAGAAGIISAPAPGAEERLMALAAFSTAAEEVSAAAVAVVAEASVVALAVEVSAVAGAVVFMAEAAGAVDSMAGVAEVAGVVTDRPPFNLSRMFIFQRCCGVPGP